MSAKKRTAGVSARRSASAFRAGAIPRSHALTWPVHGGSGSQASTYKTTVVRMMSASVNRTKRKLLHSPLALHLARRFVRPQSGKCRVSEMRVARPFRERHFRHDLRLDPHDLIHLFGRDALAPVRRVHVRQVGERTRIR